MFTLKIIFTICVTGLHITLHLKSSYLVAELTILLIMVVSLNNILLSIQK